jgi:hypothetical protein
MSTNRIGICTVSLDLLEQWMHIPPGTRICDVWVKDEGATGQFEILVKGDAVPETSVLAEIPRLNCIVTVTAPKVEFQLRDRKD